MANKKTNPQQTISFDHFLDRFPEIELPITLAEDSHYTFSKENPPLTEIMVDQYIQPYDENAADEYTEYVPCFRIPETKDFYGLVYWRAGLLTYEYVLITYDKKGNFMNKKQIGGTKAAGELLVRTVATIDEEWTLLLVGGVTESTDNNYDASKSESFQFKLTPSGQIISLN